MTTLGELFEALKGLCGGLFSLRLSPRPGDADWRHHGPSLDEASAQRDRCRIAVDACRKGLEQLAGALPPSWLGDDPQTSKYILLKRALGDVHYWLNEFGRPFRGYKMPMDCDAQDQHDDPADVKSWNDAETCIRQLADGLKDHVDLQAAKRLATSANLAAQSVADGSAAADRAAPVPSKTDPPRTDARHRLLQYAKAYIAMLQGGAELSFELEKRITAVAVELGL